MPIEFVCPRCSKMLRTPDESAGKQARCPQCASVVDVPGPSSEPFASPILEAGPAPHNPFSSPLNDARELAYPKPDQPGARGPANPYASPASAASSPFTDEPGEESARLGLPWERKERSAKTYWETCSMILTSPTLAFNVMHREGGLGMPIVFALIGGAVGGLASGVYNTLLQLGLLMFVGAAGGADLPPGFAAQTWIQVAIQLPTALAFGTIGMLIASFISAGMYHLFLMMLGGARQPFETTYRVVAYVSGTTALLQVIPLCGQHVGLIVGLIYTIIGLSFAHPVSGGKATAAVLLPIAVCGLACVALVAGVGFAVMSSFAN